MGHTTKQVTAIRKAIDATKAGTATPKQTQLLKEVKEGLDATKEVLTFLKDVK